MSKVLIISIGSPYEPAVESILHHKAEKVYFVVFEENIDVIGKIKKALKQRDENYNFEQKIIILKEPNKLEKCFLDIKEIIAELRQNNVNPRDVFVDYTGGTKSVSSALVLVTVPEGYRFSYVASRKQDEDGRDIFGSGSEEVIETENPWYTYVYAEFAKIRLYFNQYQFSSVLEILKETKKKIKNDQKLIYCFKGLELMVEGYNEWDKFNHYKALQCLKETLEIFKTYSNISGESSINKLSAQIIKNVIFLGKIATCSSDGKFDVMEIVHDLVANAERRIREGKFDDATARLYRATELGAQIILLKKGIDTGDLNTDKLPAEIREKYEKKREEDGKIRLGLLQDFELLKDLDNPLGNKCEEVKMFLSIRNNSILAHGVIPITEKACRGFLEKVKEFYRIKEDKLPVFPSINSELFLFG